MKIIKIPFSGGCLGKNIGCEKAPDEIIKNLKNFYLTEEGFLPIYQIDEIKVFNDNFEETEKNIFEKAKEILSNNQKVIFLGGDHSITYSSAKAFASLYKNPGIIIFDAHPDCCSQFNPPTHEDLVLALVDEKIIKKENIVLAGNRNISIEELRFLNENKIKTFNMREIPGEGLYEISEALMTIARNFDALYISIDIDVLDPAFAPATGYPEPGGLTTRELIYFLQRLKKLKNFKAADLVEVNPEKDSNGLTILNAAKILIELI